jgi:hypothetical protein
LVLNGGADPEKLQKAIEKHLVAQKWPMYGIDNDESWVAKWLGRGLL